MVSIPQDQVTEQELIQWYEMQTQLNALKSAEFLLRERIFKHFFPTPEEGTNNHPLKDGWVLKGKYTLNRTVDLPVFTAIRESLVAAKINPDAMIEYKPNLKLKEYRQLTAEQRHIFEACMTIKPGAPALEIVLPAKAKA